MAFRERSPPAPAGVGYIAPFDAANLDGPGEALARVLAIHPIDGLTTEGAAIVNIINVAPTITGLRLFDSADNEVGVDVPFVHTNLPVTLRATFADPGRPYHEAASHSWGDGTVESSAQFAVFTDAFGGATGTIVHAHAYVAAGAFPVQLAVQDDDGGLATAIARCRFSLRPRRSTNSSICSTKPTPRPLIARCGAWWNPHRKHLAGSASGRGNNGALDKVEKGNTNAALVKLWLAISALEDAAAAGADVGMLIDLLHQIEASIFAG
jgi:hypothetical protein